LPLQRAVKIFSIITLLPAALARGRKWHIANEGKITPGAHNLFHPGESLVLVVKSPSAENNFALTPHEAAGLEFMHIPLYAPWAPAWPLSGKYLNLHLSANAADINWLHTLIAERVISPEYTHKLMMFDPWNKQLWR